MTAKAAYVWGPTSSFSAPLIALLLKKGWHVHLATKSALNLFALTPLDITSAAQTQIEKALGGHDQLKVFQDRLHFLEDGHKIKGTTYSAIVFCGLPPNFDESRASRAPFAVSELIGISKAFPDVPIYIVSSLWSGIQTDGVVPEELEFARRKAKTQWENACQQYELKILKALPNLDSPWSLVRLPLMSGSTQDGSMLNFSGLFPMLKDIATQPVRSRGEGKVLKLDFNPDSIAWFLPVDTAISWFRLLLEDAARPRICNLVSTQATLNREWLDYAAQALSFSGVTAVEHDQYRFSGNLRQVLEDNILVKTRNLFEVLGRYKQQPVNIDVAYFQKMVAFGTDSHWGRSNTTPATTIAPYLSFSEGFARNYFQSFLPKHLDALAANQITSGGTTIGFALNGLARMRFIMLFADGQTVVQEQELGQGATEPHVKLTFSTDTLMRLVQRKVSLSQAILQREVIVDGPLLKKLRISNALNRFFNEHPYNANGSSEFLHKN
jgi:hypothetical protein